jgi:HlyD family secretion protein
MIRILLADDSITVRQKLQYMLEPEADFEIIGTADNGERAVELATTLQPDVVLLDIEMPGVDGLSATRQISQLAPNVKVLILSSFGDESYIDQSLQAGARGYLLKNTPAAELFHAIRFVQKGYLQLGPGLFEKYSAHKAQAVTSSALTDTEIRDTMPGETKVARATPAEPVDQLPKVPTSVTGTLVKPAIVGPLAPTERALPVQAESAAIQPLQKRESTAIQRKFDRPVILQQSPIWSRVIVWSIVAVSAAVTAWAFLFKIEESIQAQGTLEPLGIVKDIQSPVGGVVQSVFVTEGRPVKKGEVLLRMDPKQAQSEIVSLGKQRQQLLQENQFYREVLTGNSSGAPADVEIPANFLSLTRDRDALIAENRLFQARLDGGGSGFTAAELGRIQASNQRAASNVQGAQLEAAQAVKRTSQSEMRLSQNLSEQEQNQIKLGNAQDNLKLNQEILADIQPVYESGAIARLQYRRQQAEFQNSQAEVAELQEESVRLRQQELEIREQIAENSLAVEQAGTQVTSTQATSSEDLYDRIAANAKQIDTIDSQLSRRIVENEQRLTDIDNRLNQARITVQYQELRSPVDGVVFDLKAHTPGFVANASEPIMKIVPKDNLRAKLYIPNQDIGFVRNNFLSKKSKNEEVKVDIRIDSFNYSEYGDIKGNIAAIASDALPPSEVRPFASFPVEVTLDSQTLKINKGTQDLALQSGMSVSANIKLRNRPIISLITDQFSKQVENLKYLR